MLERFAAQAVTTIENARRIAELHERKDDLAESLEYQAATSDVLKVVSRSGAELQPVLDTLVETAARICRAESGFIFRRQDGSLHMIASFGVPIEYKEFQVRNPIALGRGSLAGRTALEGRAIQIEDAAIDPEYTRVQAVNLGNQRTMLGAPLVRENSLIGVITLARTRVEPFSDKQTTLVATFADQAVIAIENARLLGELREKTDELAHSVQELKALNEVSQATSSTLDFKQVLTTILTHSVELSGADAGIGFGYSRSARAYRLIEAQGWDAKLIEVVRALHIDENETGMGQAAALRMPLQFPDLATRPSFPLRDVTLASGFRSVLILPLVGAETLYGSIVLERRIVGEFPESTVRLMQTLANQSVLAIRNAQLLGEVQTARDTAEAALSNLKAAQANLIQAEKMASLGQLTAGIAHEIKNPLNFVNNFASLSVDLLDELKHTAAPGFAMLETDRRAEIDDLARTLTSNLEKINEHGRRADGIVRGMLEHSRGSSGERRSTNLNALVDEAMNLAYHGARAQDPDFNVVLQRDLDEGIAPIMLVPQDVTRALLNLFSNGFYAAHKRLLMEARSGFDPSLKVRTRELGGAVEIRVHDNGIGIPAEIRDKLFQPFFTTKPTGEGTGLGLSISYDIVIQQHGGSITVDSKVGEYSEFTIRLPRYS